MSLRVAAFNAEIFSDFAPIIFQQREQNLVSFLYNFAYETAVWRANQMNLIQHIFTLLLLGLLGFSCASVKTNSRLDDKSPLRLYVFECGENNVSDLSLFAPGIGKNVKKKLTVSCYVIKHPQGYLLWDSGLADEIADEKDGMLAANGKFHLTVKKPFIKQLAEIGLKPTDFKYIAFSHFHADHVGNANAFKGATLLIQEEEFAAAFGGDPQKFNFNSKTYSSLSAGPVIKLTSDHDVFGDGSVVIKRAPGHTPGHQILFINLAKTGPIVLSGDLYHFAENRRLKRVPAFNFDKDETKKSMTDIENFIRQKNATLWIQHDFEQAQSLRHAPEFYE